LESKFDFLATRQRLVKIGEGQQKIKIVRTNQQSNLRGSCQSNFSLPQHLPTLLRCIMTSPSLLVATATKAKTAPFVVISTSRAQAEVIHKHCLVACPDTVIKKYNSDSLAANCKDFDDVNKAWTFCFLPQPSVLVAVLNSCISLVSLDISHH